MRITFVLGEVVALLFVSGDFLGDPLGASCCLRDLLSLLGGGLLFDCFLCRGFLLFLSFGGFDLLGHW